MQNDKPDLTGFTGEDMEFGGATGLMHVSNDDPGYTRRKCGRGFIYLDEKGNKITDPEIIDRIKNIGIPPVWEDVWISISPMGYLQATGIDVKNRKQYLYHEHWIAYQQHFKFRKILKFGETLPKIRKTVSRHIRKKGWPKEKVLALIVGILDETFLRIGNKQYQELYGTSGLTTLRRKNLEINGKDIIFKYKAKSQKYRRVTIRNIRFTRLIRECSELQGYEVFRYVDETGKTIPVDSKDVNEYLKEITGEPFTSKNFRTWGGTVLAVKKFPVALEKVAENKRLKLRKAIVKEVAGELNNTIAVCQKYYIHPAVLDILSEGNFSRSDYSIKDLPEDLDDDEKLALAIIRKNPEFGG